MNQLTGKSEFHNVRSQYQPQLPQLLKLPELVVKTHNVAVLESIRSIFTNLCKGETVQAVTFEPTEVSEHVIRAPLRIGCVLSGGQAAGGHNVIVGLYEQIKRRHPNSQLFGFLQGPVGIYTGKYMEIKDDMINYFKNRGGFDMIQSGRHKIETEEQFQKSLQYCQTLKLDGLVVIGGDDSNTNACLLAEYFLKHGCHTGVIGCPKTIDGDLKNEFVEVSFGFDTACKTYSELIGNIMLDTVSSKKYYHFIRLMGRSASHITLECALLTKPNWAYIGEEIEAQKLTLNQIVSQLADLIVQRANLGKNYGVILVPEGLIEFIDEAKNLISEINVILGKDIQNPEQYEAQQLQGKVSALLSRECAALLNFLPKSISEQLLLDRDPHGNVQVAKIETEKLLVAMVETELAKRKLNGTYKSKFTAICHYYGYEGRCAFPTTFDCDYCYSLGVNAALLIEAKQTGMMSCIRNLDKDPEHWQASGYPLVTMMDVEIRKGKYVPVIKKALTELNGPIFKKYQQYREVWNLVDHYQSPGPIQFYFPALTPFLIKAPTDQQLNLGADDIDYSKDKPYDEIQRKNLSILGFERTKTIAVIPDNLKLNLGSQVIPTQYSNSTRKALQQHYPELFTHSANQIKFTISNQQPEKRSMNIGITFNGRQSPGGNVVIQGLLEFADQTGSTLYGFLGGTQGLFENQTIKITQSNYSYYANQGGYHFLGRTADKMRSEKELLSIKQTCQTLDLDGLIVVGATHSMTDSIIVANYLLKENVKTRIITIPCTVDNNIGHPMLEGIIGFDSASKTYSQQIGNIMIDAASAVKYWYFIRLMGRDPSHLVLECALQTHPNVVLISEDIASRDLTLSDVVSEIADIVVLRSNNGKEFGTVLVPEGLLAHIGQFKQLLIELSKAFSTFPKDKEAQEQASQKLLKDPDTLKSCLTPWSAALFLDLPDFTQKQLVLEREVHGGVQLSQIETERLISYLVTKELRKRKEQKQYKGSFSSICHFFGYQGRCAFPSLFDCQLAATYGYLAGLLVFKGLTGYCVAARGITGPTNKWHFGAIPLLHMTSMKQKSAYGENEPIINSHEVELKKGPFLHLQQSIADWRLTDHYENPGPVQFFGPMANKSNMTLELSYKNYVDQIEQIEQLLENITDQCRYETQQQLLDVTVDSLQVLLKTIIILKLKQ